MPSLVAVAPAVAALPTLLIAAAVCILGVVVIARERSNSVSISFFGLTITVGTWLIGVSFTIMAFDPRSAFFFARLTYIGVALIPATCLHFTIALLDEMRERRTVLVLSWIASGTFAALFSTTRILLHGTWHYDWGYYPRLSAAATVFLVYFVLALGSSLALIVFKSNATEQEHRRNMAFLAALSVGYLASIDYLPAFGVAIYPIGCFAILGFTILSARAVLRLRLSDLSPSFVASQMLQTVHGGVIVVDTHARIRVANAAAAQLLGYSLGEIRGADLRQLLGVYSLPMTKNDSFVRRAISRNRPMPWRRKDGSEIELAVSATNLRNGPEDVGVLYAITDLSDRRRADRHEYSATHDQLTRLPNRTRFFEMFPPLAQSVTDTGRVAGVFFLDLDGFKGVNDTHGHATGDALLQLVAQRLRNAVRGDDVIARYGGDEFVLLLNLARVADGQIVADKLLRVIGDQYAIGDERINITASIGASFYPRDAASLEELIGIADSAMYSAKSAGKARLHVAAPPAERKKDIAARPPFGIDARA